MADDLADDDDDDSAPIERGPRRRMRLTPLEKLEKLQKEKAALVACLDEGTVNDVRTKVAFILNHNRAARNSDVALAIHFWRTFHADDVDAGGIPFDAFFRLTRYTTLARARAKIQNEFGLFQPDEDVAVRRKALATEHAEREYDSKPSGAPTIHVLCDESGKTGEHYVLGSVWILDEVRFFKLYQALLAWKREHGLEREFHFNKLSRLDVDKALGFVRRALQESDTLGIKVIAIARSGSGARTVDEAIFKLHEHLIIKGLEHEIRNKRVELPRHISLIKDKDDGADRMRIAELERNLVSACGKLFIDKVRIESIEGGDSKENPLLQLADLVAGSVARVLGRAPGAERNHKDDFAENLLELLGIGVDLEMLNNSDFATVIRL